MHASFRRSLSENPKHSPKRSKQSPPTLQILNISEATHTLPKHLGREARGLRWTVGPAQVPRAEPAPPGKNTSAPATRIRGGGARQNIGFVNQKPLRKNERNL